MNGEVDELDEAALAIELAETILKRAKREHEPASGYWLSIGDCRTCRYRGDCLVTSMIWALETALTQAKGSA